MASISFTLARGAEIDTLSAGAQTITEGTQAPSTGDLEVRIDLTKNFTKREVRQALNSIARYILDPGRTTSIPL